MPGETLSPAPRHFLVPSPGMSSSGSSSSSRKEFDVKQILRIRWRWFGHPPVPPQHSPQLGDYFAGRRAGGSPGDGPGPSVSGCGSAAGVNPSPGGHHGGLVASGSAGSNLCDSGGRKFADPAGGRGGPGGAAAGAPGSSCPRSVSQPECRSSAAAGLSWVSPPPHRRARPLTSMDPPGEAPEPVPDPSGPVCGEEAAAAPPGTSGTEEGNHPETDSSSCR